MVALTTTLTVSVTDPVLITGVNRKPSGMRAGFINQREGALFVFITQIACGLKYSTYVADLMFAV